MHLRLLTFLTLSLIIPSCTPVTPPVRPPATTAPSNKDTETTLHKESVTTINSNTSSTHNLPPTKAKSPTAKKGNTRQAEVTKPATQKATSVPAADLQKKITPNYQQLSRSGITLSLVSFDDRSHLLRVADQQNGPGSQWKDARSAAAKYKALAAINAGFFTPEGKPLGILIENGTRRGSINASSLGAGMIHSAPNKSSIFRKNQFSSTKHQHGNLIQTGPMLAENSGTISGLSKTNRRHRSFIAWDKKHHWLIGYASPCTLNELSHTIAGKTLAGVKIHSAINLDGGRSSDLWVSNKVRNGGKTHRTFINKTVRNYLLLIPR